MERPNKIRRHSPTGQTDIHSYPSTTGALSGTALSDTGRSRSPAKIEMMTSYPHESALHQDVDDAPTIQQQTTSRVLKTEEANEPEAAKVMISNDDPVIEARASSPAVKEQSSSESSKAEMMIISDDEGNGSLFDSPPVSPKDKNETQARAEDQDTNGRDATDMVVISDDEDDDDSLFGAPSSSDEEEGPSSKEEEPLAGVDTPEAMSCVLMPHQRIGLEWLLKHEHGADKGGVLADDMGLGKTIQALALIFANPPTDPTRKTTLIVAPLSLLQQWPREIDEKTKRGHKLRVHVFHGKGRQISVRQLLSCDVVLTNYESVTAEYKMAENKKKGMVLLDPNVRFHRVILDEAHNIKNRDALVAKGVFRLQADYRLAMTGTPLMNKPEELYSAMRFLDIPLYNEWEYFNRHISRPLKEEEFCNSTLSLIAIRRLNDLRRRTMLVRKKTDCLDGKPIIKLPGRTDVVEYCTFDNDELAFYIALQNKVQVEIQKFMKASRGQKQFTNLLVELLRLRQACCHPNLLASYKAQKGEEPPQYLEDLDPETLAAIEDSENVGKSKKWPPAHINFSTMTREEIAAMLAKPEPAKKPKRKALTKTEKLEYYRELEEDYQPSAKITKTLEILTAIQSKGAQDKIIIFSFFTSFLDILAIGMRRAGFAFKRYDGTLNAAEKDVVIREFTSPTSKTKILLTSLRSGNAGLNLNIANHVILEEPYWNPFIEQQAIDRAHRIGQKKHVHVHRLLVKETVEDRITALQEKKRAMVDIALGTGDSTELRQQREKIGGLTKEDVFDLLRPGLELPDGVMKDDVKDNFRLFSPTTNGSAGAPTGGTAKGPMSVPTRDTARASGTAPAAGPVRLPRTLSTALSSARPKVSSTGRARNSVGVTPALESRVPTRAQIGIQPRVQASSSIRTPIGVSARASPRFGEESPAESSTKKPAHGPTDWNKLLAKHGGQRRRKF